MPLAKINCPERVARLVRKNSNEQRVKALKDEKTAQDVHHVERRTSLTQV